MAVMYKFTHRFPPAEPGGRPFSMDRLFAWDEKNAIVDEFVGSLTVLKPGETVTVTMEDVNA